ncbi:MAG: ABC transporter ATP-binding protein [Acidobacteria bacterium]|nr:ABC transporter ATP-binding protein [Acidobacteriota bacterium]
MRFGKHVVLDGLDLRVEKGSVYALIGSNGAGKTTTLQILMNLLRGARGRASVLGVESTRLRSREYARIGYVSEGQEMPDAMTVSEFLAFWRPFYPEWDSARERELLELFRLPLDRKLKHLSRGMRMKVSLASSLAYRPELIVLDEPFSGLDPLVREEFVEGLIAFAEGSTVLISSHDLGEIEHFASHVGFLDDGRIQFSEEMSGLTARFREVEVTMDAASLPPRIPDSWVRAETTAAVVRFVETQWDAVGTRQAVREIFPAATRVEVRAMPLRSIFVALAKAARKAA